MISVIIPTRNRAELLANALQSLMWQTLSISEFEIIVVNNASTDGTTKVISDFNGKLQNLSCIDELEPGLHAGRHAGMLLAKGDIIVFADDDIEALPNWLMSIKEVFADKEVAMAGGNNYPLFLKTPPEWLLKMWNRRQVGGYKAISQLSIIEFIDKPRKYSPYMIWGCNFAIRKEVLLAAGGFHPDGMPKDMICFRGDGETHISKFVHESGMKCVFHSGASVYHKVTPERMTYEYFKERGFNQGVSDSYTKLRKMNNDYKKNAKKNILKTAIFRFRRISTLFYDKEVKYALEQFRIGHAEGFAYHQQAYHENPEVRRWVHLPNYY